MRFAVVGAGAVGAYLGAKLANSGEDVVLVARGPHLQAMQAHGVRVRSSEGDFEAHPTSTDSLEGVGPVDFLFLTVKAHSLAAVAPRLAALLGPDTAVVSAQNGIPWWYFQRHGGPWEGTHLETVDPGKVISTAITPERVIGCVVYPSTSLVEPGVIEHIEGDRFGIGELDGSTTDRCRDLSRALTKSGLRGPIRSRIRHDIWVKLLGNVAFNPISALTRATLYDMTAHAEVRELVRAVMEEADAVARSLGVEMPVSIEQRIAGAQKVGHHKTSMLQDLETGRPMELESIVGAVVELGDKAGVPMPHTRAVYACAKLLADAGTSH